MFESTLAKQLISEVGMPSVSHDWYESAESIPIDRVFSELAEANVNPTTLVKQTKDRALALNQYISEYVETADLAPERLRRRLGLCCLMGGLPLMISTALAIVVFAGMIADHNSLTLAYIVVIGGAMVALLATLVAIHLTTEAYVHQWVTRRSLLEERTAMAKAINELMQADKPDCSSLIAHFKRYNKLAHVLSLIDH